LDLLATVKVVGAGFPSFPVLQSFTFPAQHIQRDSAV
jgi:hypothetical protein